jgi:lactoylglutathione lyase
MGTRFDMIGLFVRDLRKMVEFYHETLGVDITWDGTGPYAEFSHEGIRLAMYERRELPGLLGKEPGYPHGLNGTFELAINVGKPENVNRRYEQIIQKGGTAVYPPRDEPWKMRSAMISDPEGNLIEIASDFWD